MLGIPIFIWWILIFVISVVWILLPFAVFGLKGRLDKIIENTEETNEHLSMLRKEMAVNPSSQEQEATQPEQTLPSGMKAER